LRVAISTWNINSVRIRVDLVARFLLQAGPDTLCLQEIKCPTELFPREAFARLGYPYQAVFGQKGYHGVAVLSRRPFDQVFSWGFCGRGDGRHVAVRFAEPGLLGLTLHNLYVPAGGDVPDPELNDKFAHKLAFVDEMAERFAAGAREPGPAVLVGDLNIAPLENDVWSHRQLLKVVSHTPVEVAGLSRVLEAGGWIDTARALIPAREKAYTWWSYRSPDWASADKGRRLDHIWISPDLEPALAGIGVCREARGWERPSDHVPATVLLDLARADPAGR